MRLASGLEIEATANHPFRTVTGWSRLDELSRGAMVAVPRSLPSPTREGLWNEDELILLAHLLGDGSIGLSGVKYATADPANKAVVEETAQRLFGITVSGKQQNGKTWLLWFPSPYRLTHGRHHPIRNWLEPYGLWGHRSHDKFIPEEIFGLPNQQLALFLRHLWATDGSITIGRNQRGAIVRIYYATTSRQLADGVRRALLRLNIRSRLSRARKVGYRDCWHVRIEGAENMIHFLTAIGCHGQRGERIPEALTALQGHKGNPNVDLIPNAVSETVRSALKEAGVTHRSLATALDERYCGSYLLGSDKSPRRFSRPRLAKIAAILQNSELAALASSDVFWDEVVEITPLGEMPTFDVTVDVAHNFVANGIVAHNSLEQDSDIVMFLYRDDVYNPESQDRGTAEVIVSKHRNGPTGVTQLAFLDHYTRFANMARV
jgi:replicative DNA helicase